MYFPYFRGRQFELIALRELVEDGILSDRIIPIIEPVKLSATLLKTINTYIEKERTLAIVRNPSVGEFDSELGLGKNEKMAKKYKSILQDDNILHMYLLNGTIASNGNFGNYSNDIGTISENKDSINIYNQFFSGKEIKYNLIPDESIFRRKINNKIILEDRFNKQERNSDYINLSDEPFSEDHLYYEDDGYIGFSDYSIIGKGYTETGFAPYAVAIHIVYFDKDKGLRVKHFVSDTNTDIKDTALKFSEALDKLIVWEKSENIETRAIEEFKKLYENKQYPGLGTVKKLSIKHHLELIGDYLEK